MKFLSKTDNCFWIRSLKIIILCIPFIVVILILNSCSQTKTPIVTAQDLRIEYDGESHGVVAKTDQDVLIIYYYEGKDIDYSSEKEPTDIGIYSVTIKTLPVNGFKVASKVVSLTIFSLFEKDINNIYTVYNGTKKDVVIPSTYTNQKNGWIDPHIFDGHNIESIKFPEGDFTVIPNLLNNINTLQTIYINQNTILLSGNYPPDLKIEYYDNPSRLLNNKFKGVFNLKEFTIPASIVKIEELALLDINVEKINLSSTLSLSNISISGTVKEVFIYKANTYDKMVNEILQRKSIEKVILDSSIDEISEGAFSNCDSLKYINLDNIKIINNLAFAYCSSLETINLPDGLLTLGNQVFGNCVSLTSFEIPESIINYGSGIFWECINLKSVILPSNLTTITDGMFYGCISLEEIIIPDTVITIGAEAFGKCESLSKLIIPDNVISSNLNIIKDCNNLVELVLGKNLIYLVESLSNNNSLESITLRMNFIPNYFMSLVSIFPLNVVFYVQEELILEYQKLAPNSQFEIIQENNYGVLYE